jgi:hypothetical protein
MRSILVTALLIIVVVGLYYAVFGGDSGLVHEIGQHESAISEHLMQLNP